MNRTQFPRQAKGRRTPARRGGSVSLADWTGRLARQVDLRAEIERLRLIVEDLEAETRLLRAALARELAARRPSGLRALRRSR